MTLGRSPVATTARASGVSAARNCSSSSSPSVAKAPRAMPVGALLDVVLECSAFRRQLPVGGQQTALGEPRGDLLATRRRRSRGPRVITSRVVAPAATCRTWASRPATPAAISAATWPSPRCSRRSVAACQSDAERILRPRERGVGGEQWSTVERRRPAPRVRPVRRPSARSDSMSAPSNARRSAAVDPAARASSATSGGAIGPGVRHRLRHTPSGEVVEGCGNELRPDGAERCRPLGEVAHPVPAVSGRCQRRRPVPGRSR